mgnify:CR=1 FL=1
MRNAASQPDPVAQARLHALVDGYRPLAGTRDEMVDASGRPRRYAPASHPR